jgi:hypothetical protein
MKKIFQSQTKKKHQPNPLTKKEMINPKLKGNKIAANLNSKDGEKGNRQEIDESRSDGSANAFEGTEELRDDE